ncbi:hypothetical protein RUM43_001550 [Polyplax serrata]|uniref:Uncharacterized protein n=1 Tax=Polyplax serrata TaxID=468196 RepID=A0AAN8SFL0_POLSC
MLSFGIRFGEGFDRNTILKLMDSIPTSYEYDFLVLGASPGGIACAREARMANKKVAIVRWTTYSAAEDEGFNEDLEKMYDVLHNDYNLLDSTNSQSKLPFPRERRQSSFSMNVSKTTISFKGSESGKPAKKGVWYRKVRQSRLDLNNELYRRSKEGRKLMLKAAACQKSLSEASKYGWRITASFDRVTMNWKKFSDFVMDFMMRENWALMDTLVKEGVDIIEGKPSLVNNHTVKIQPLEGKEFDVTGEILCAAPLTYYILPESVPGAGEFGITCDDFLRLCESPGKTLIVGATPEGLECAGILACLNIPVFLVSRSEPLKGYDRGMTELVLDNLKSNGVIFMEKTTLVSIKLVRRGRLSAIFSKVATEDGELSDIKDDEFDTVVFAVGKRASLKHLNLSEIGVEINPDDGKILTGSNDMTAVQNIYAVGEAVFSRPRGNEIFEVTGKLLGKRLFFDKTETMDYTMLPYVLITPIEYAFIGISEDGALHRFGTDCIDVLQGTFTPIELEISKKKPQCLMKVIVFRPKNQVIGLHVFGPEAGEIIQGFAGHMKLGITAEQLETIVCVSGTKAQELIKLKKPKVSEEQDSIYPPTV